MTPLVSVIIPCYNQGHFLRESIDSALTQSCADAEIIVVDDGSTDETGQVAASYGDRIRYVRKTNAGLSAARNTGILRASGDFVQFLDADDFLLPDRFEKFLGAMRNCPEADVYFSSWHVVDEAGRYLRSSDPVYQRNEDLVHRYLKGNIFPCHAAILRRVALANSGVFDPLLRSFEDWDLWLRLAISGATFRYFASPTVAYRQRECSMSRDYGTMLHAGQAVLSKRLGHPRCGRCNASRALGRRSLRADLYHNVVRPEFNTLWDSRNFVRLGQRILSVAKRDPAVCFVMVRKSLRSIIDRVERTTTRRSGQHAQCSDPDHARS